MRLNLSNIQVIEKPSGKDEEEAKEVEEANTAMIEQLCHFMKRNKRLTHVDLSYTGLQESHLK